MALTSRERARDDDRVVETRTRRAVGPGRILGAVGAVGAIVSIFLPWRDGGIYPSDIPVAFLWNRGSTSGPSLLIVLIPIAVVLVIGVFVAMGAGVRLFGAIGALVVAGLFAYQLHRTVNAFGGDLGDVLDSGFYAAAIGGVVAFVSGLLPSGSRTASRDRPRRRRHTGIAIAQSALLEIPNAPRRDDPRRGAFSSRFARASG